LFNICFSLKAMRKE